MLYDHQAEEQQRKELENYEKLKTWISNPEGNKLNKWFLASRHLNAMEHRMRKLEKRIHEYEAFFSTMRSLMPRVHSVHDIIG